MSNVYIYKCNKCKKVVQYEKSYLSYGEDKCSCGGRFVRQN